MEDRKKIHYTKEGEFKVNSRGLYSHGKVNINSKAYYLEEYYHKTIEQYRDEFDQMIVNYHKVSKEGSPFPEYYLEDNLIFIEYLKDTTLQNYFQKNKKVERRFVFNLLLEVIKVLEFLDKLKLVHRKLSLNKIFIERNESAIKKIKIIGAKYLKEVNAIYLEAENWLALPNSSKGPSEITNVSSFGWFLGELISKLIESDKELCHTLQEIMKRCLRYLKDPFNLRELKDKIIDISRDSYEHKLKNYDIKFIECKAEHRNIFKDIKKASKDLRDTMVEKKDLSVFRVKNCFVVHSGVIVINEPIPKDIKSTPLSKYLENKKLDEGEIKWFLVHFIWTLRKMLTKRLIFCVPKFTNIYVSKNEGVYIEDTYTIPLFTQKEMMKAFGEVFYSLLHDKEVKYKPEESKGAKLDKWRDIFSNTINGKWLLKDAYEYIYEKLSEEERKKYKYFEYIRLERIGHGVSSTVHKVISRDKKEYALKVFKEGRDASFREERKKLEEFKDWGYIIDYHGSFSYRGEDCLVLELFDCDLKKYIEDNSVIDLKDIKLIAENIGKAIRSMHRERRPHTDIKLDNIFVSYDEKGIKKVKLGDLDNTEGAPNYRPPGENPDPFFKDVWAYGLVLLALISKDVNIVSRIKESGSKKPSEEIKNSIENLVKENKKAETECKKIKEVLEACLNVDLKQKIEEIIKKDYFK